jgi:hypothetical protein
MEVQFEPALKAKLDQIARESGRAAADLVQDAVAGYVGELAERNARVPSIAHLQKTNPKEWMRQFREWAESHDRTTPLLSDEAVSRESIYPDRI